MKESKVLSVLTSLLTAVVLLTGTVAVPILWRGFYYGQIDALALPARTGFSRPVIQGAFDQVMDYLVKGAEFGTGQLKWSADGRDHFADCRTLFRLDFILLGVCTLFLLLIVTAVLRGKVRLHRFLGRGPCFCAFVGMAAAVLVLGVWGLADFESLFTAFHSVFFPGKTNWVFDYRLDQIILILPEDFWMRAAGLVAGLAFGAGALLSVLQESIHRARQPKNLYEQLKRTTD